MKTKTLFALAASVAALASPLAAQSAGDWALGFGVGLVDPQSDNGTLAGAAATIDDNVKPIFTAEYFIADNVGIELLVATPFNHSIALGGNTIGSTRQLPPTLSVNYHFKDIGGGFRPFVGLGVNYTTFFSEESSLGTLKLDDSFGIAATVGVEYDFNEKSSLRVDARYINIETDATLNGAAIGTAEIDPVVFGISYVTRF